MYARFINLFTFQKTEKEAMEKIKGEASQRYTFETLQWSFISLFDRQLVYLFIYLFIYLFNYLFIYLFIYVFSNVTLFSERLLILFYLIRSFVLSFFLSFFCSTDVFT